MKNLLALTLNGTPIQAPGGIPSGGLNTSGTSGSSIISNGILDLIVFTAILSLFVIILSGIQWITSGGDKNKLQAARSRLTFAIVGLIIAFLGFFIISFFGHLFGITFFSPAPYANPCPVAGQPC